MYGAQTSADLYRKAVACLESGDLRGAEAHARELLQQSPGEPARLALLGSIHGRQGRHRDALNAFAAALQGDQTNADLYLNHGLAAARLGELESAAASFSEAVRLRPRWDEAHYQSGEAERRRNRPDAAQAALERALALNPDHARAHAALALVFEKTHRLDAAAQSAERALALAPADASAKLVLAQIALRKADPDAAAAILQTMLAGSALTPQNQAYAQRLMGDIHDSREDYGSAFTCYQRAKNALSRLYSERKTDTHNVYSLAAINRLKNFHLARPPARWRTFTPDPPLTLAFLVGFPRSGTTLLDQILNAHPAIRTIEEKPLLPDAMQAFLAAPESLDRLPQLPDAEIRRFRGLYLRRLRACLDGDDDDLVIDKLPLNLINLGLIWRLFPEARIILALRDPRAVVWSCFKQNFGLNDAMAHMLSLESIAGYYTAVMALGRLFERQLPLAQHRVRYEDLIESLEGETRNVLDFLDLPWSSSVLDYRETARKRAIDTPSYSQVVKPIYTDSKAQWRNYEDYLAPVIPQLTPFIEAYGYMDSK